MHERSGFNCGLSGLWGGISGVESVTIVIIDKVVGERSS